jgi:hypothetical protein
MLRKTSLAVMAAVAGAMMAGGLATEASAKNCVPKAAEGTGGTEENAKFQVYEALLQATDRGAWAAWMANGKKGGLGVTCRGQTTICKL